MENRIQPSAQQPEWDEGTSAAPEPWAELSQDPPAVRETSAVLEGDRTTPCMQFGTPGSEAVAPKTPLGQCDRDLTEIVSSREGLDVNSS